MNNPEHPDRNTAERAFLDAYDATEFERPSVAVDVAILSSFDGQLHALLVQRTEHPHLEKWALPGGFIRMDESLDDAAARVLADKAGLTDVFLEQLYTFGAVQRDPRTRVITAAYYALVDAQRFQSMVRAPARIVVPWSGETGGPVELMDGDGQVLTLAFDHADILGMAVLRIRGKLDYTPIGFQLLPPTFTLRQLLDVHQTVLGKPLNKDSFRRRMLATGLLQSTGERQQDVGHRPAALYRYRRRSE